MYCIIESRLDCRWCEYNCGEWSSENKEVQYDAKRVIWHLVISFSRQAGYELVVFLNSNLIISERRVLRIRSSWAEIYAFSWNRNMIVICCNTFVRSARSILTETGYVTSLMNNDDSMKVKSLSAPGLPTAPNRIKTHRWQNANVCVLGIV